MNKSVFGLAMVAALTGVSAVASADPFVRFSEVPEAERLPRGASLGVARDGTFLVNGKPRYLTATLFYGGTDKDAMGHASGYPADLNWLYEDLPDYEGMQRIGVDALGFEAGREWMLKVSPTAAPKWMMSGCLPASEKFAPTFAGQLPAYVDFTPAEWGHGGLKPKDNPQLPQEAWTVGMNHWVPYSIFHPEGRKLWLTMWREEAKRYSKLAVQPYCYELMNEPAVYDTGAYAKECFKKTGAKDDPVAYLKFMDAAFAEFIGEGAKAVREEQPGAMVTLQPLGHCARGIDLYEIYRRLDLVCSPTGGGGIGTAHLLRAMAEGKPIVDGETYIGQSMESVRNALVSQFQRGFNASYTFKWSRRPRDWVRGADAKVEAELAKKVPYYNFLIPYNVPPKALVGFRLAKRDALDIGEFFVLRDRGTPRRIAILYSKPTERLALLDKSIAIELHSKVIDELEYAHLNPDVIFEEQLRDEPERIGRYDMLVAAGVEAVYPHTPAAIRAWQKSGGKLVMVGERMAKDEFGKANGEEYPGATYLKSEGVSAEEIGRQLREIAEQVGILPTCETKGAVKVEVTDAARDGMFAWIITSRTVAPQIARFRVRQRGEMTITIRNVRKADGKVVSERREMRPDEEGSFPMLLRPGDCNIVVSGPREKLMARYPKAEDAEWLVPISAEEAAKESECELAADRRARMTKKGGYHIEANRTRQLDLRRLANVRKLTDRQWGRHELEGVPFEFIRTDENFFKDAIALKNGGERISLAMEGRAQHVYFVCEGNVKATIDFADGETESFEIPAGEGNVWRVWRWTSAHSDKSLAKLDMQGKGENAIVYAITVEAPAERTMLLAPKQVKGFRSFSGKILEPRFENGTIEMRHGETARSWSGGYLTMREAVRLPSEWTKAWLVMEVNKLPNRYGAFSVAPSIQVAIEGGYRTPTIDDRLTAFSQVDDDSSTWETLYVPIVTKNLKEGAIKKISFQYKTVGTADPSALAFMNLRFVGE